MADDRDDAPVEFVPSERQKAEMMLSARDWRARRIEAIQAKILKAPTEGVNSAQAALQCRVQPVADAAARRMEPKPNVSAPAVAKEARKDATDPRLMIAELKRRRLEGAPKL